MTDEDQTAPETDEEAEPASPESEATDAESPDPSRAEETDPEATDPEPPDVSDSSDPDSETPTPSNAGEPIPDGPDTPTRSVDTGDNDEGTESDTSATDNDSDDGDGPAIQSPGDVPDPSGGNGNQPGVPDDVAKYDRFKKMDGAQYDRVNEFLRERTYVTAREWAIARLCADFRTETGVEMTKIGENLPELVPFMTDTYTPQAVNQARSAFDDKVRKAGATFLYGAMCDFYTAEELDDVMYEVTEVAKFLLEVEGIDLSVEEELDAEDQISTVMREVRESSAELRYEECPECGHELGDAD